MIPPRYVLNICCPRKRTSDEATNILVVQNPMRPSEVTSGFSGTGVPVLAALQDAGAALLPASPIHNACPEPQNVRRSTDMNRQPNSISTVMPIHNGPCTNPAPNSKRVCSSSQNRNSHSDPVACCVRQQTPSPNVPATQLLSSEISPSIHKKLALRDILPLQQVNRATPSNHSVNLAPGGAHSKDASALQTGLQLGLQIGLQLGLQMDRTEYHLQRPLQHKQPAATTDTTSFHSGVGEHALPDAENQRPLSPNHAQLPISHHPTEQLNQASLCNSFTSDGSFLGSPRPQRVAVLEDRFTSNVLAVSHQRHTGLGPAHPRHSDVSLPSHAPCSTGSLSLHSSSPVPTRTAAPQPEPPSAPVHTQPLSPHALAYASYSSHTARSPASPPIAQGGGVGADRQQQCTRHRHAGCSRCRHLHRCTHRMKGSKITEAALALEQPLELEQVAIIQLQKAVASGAFTDDVVFPVHKFLTPVQVSHIILPALLQPLERHFVLLLL